MDRSAQIKASRNKQEKSIKKYNRAVAEELVARLELDKLVSKKEKLEQNYANSMTKTTDLANKIAISCRTGDHDKSNGYYYQQRKARSVLAGIKKELQETELEFKEVAENYKFTREMLKIAKNEMAESYQKALDLKSEIDNENAKKAKKIRQLAAYAKVPTDKLDIAYVKPEQNGDYGVYFDSTDEKGQVTTNCHIVTSTGLIFRRNIQTQELSII